MGLLDGIGKFVNNVANKVSTTAKKIVSSVKNVVTGTSSKKTTSTTTSAKKTSTKYTASSSSSASLKKTTTSSASKTSTKTTPKKTTSTSSKKTTTNITSKIQASLNSNSSTKSTKKLSSSDYQGVLAQKNITINKSTKTTKKITTSASSSSSKKITSSSKSTAKTSLTKKLSTSSDNNTNVNSFLNLTTRYADAAKEAASTSSSFKIVSKLTGNDKKEYVVNTGKKTTQLTNNDYTNIFAEMQLGTLTNRKTVSFGSTTLKPTKTTTGMAASSSGTAEKDVSDVEPEKEKGSLFSRIGNGVKSLFNSAVDLGKKVVTTVGTGIKKTVDTVVNTGKKFVDTVVNTGKKVVTTVGTGIKKTVDTVVNTGKKFVDTVVNTGKKVVTTVGTGIKKAVTTVENGVKKAVTTVGTGIKKAVTTVENGLKNAGNAIKTFAGATVTGVSNFITNASNTVKETVSGWFKKDDITTTSSSSSSSSSSTPKTAKPEATIPAADDAVDICLQSAEIALEQRRNEILAEQDSLIGFGKGWNFVQGLWGGGTKGDLKELEELEELYELADKNPTTENLNRLTQAFFGTDADLVAAQESYNLSVALSQGIPLEDGTVLTAETLAQLVVSQSAGLSDTFDANLSSQGAFSRGINWVNNNFTGFGTTQRMTEAQLDTYNNLTESLQNCSDPVEFAAIFKEATGQDLSYDSINQLLGGVSVVDNSHAAESMMDYENTQDSLKTATTAIATGIVVAATGGAALPAVAAGAAINVGVNAFDAATQNNGQSAVENLAVYAREDLVTDALVGGINGGTALIGSALGQKFTTGITAHIGNAAGSKAATLGVKTAGNFIDGAVDGGLSSGAEYIVGQIKNGESVNLSTLADVTIIGGVAGGAMSAVAGTFSKGNTAKTETTPDTGKPSSLLSDGADAPKMVSDVRGNAAKTETTPAAGKPSSLLSDSTDAPKTVSNGRGNAGKTETTPAAGKPSSLLSNGTDAPKTVSEGRGNAASGQDSPKLNGDTSKSLSEGKIDTGSKPDVDTPKTKPDTHVDADNRKPKNSGSSSNTDNIQYKTDTAKITPSNALGKNTSSEAMAIKSDVNYIQSNDSIVKNASSNTSIKTDSVTQRVKSPDNNSIPESKPSSTSNSTNLDKYKVDRNKQYLSEKEFSKKHEQFFIDENGNFVVNKDSKYQISGSSTWYSSKSGKNNNHTAWKMHIYSDNIKDFQDIMDVVSPYLSDNNIRHKILNTDVGFDKLNSGVQKGKSITIYPSSVSEMERVSCDLDYIIRNNNLEINGSNIIGDNMMGDTGRLFYRYEFKSGKYQDMSLDLNERLTPEMADKYGFDKNLVGTNLQDVYEKNLYDANRGENNYLASDMTVDDDIWLDFDPTTGKRTGVPYKTDAVNSTYSDISVPKSNAEEIPLKSDVQRIEAGKTDTVKSEDSVNSSNTTDSVVNSNHYVNPSDGQIFEIYGKRISNLKGKNYIEVDGKWKEVPDLNFNTNQLAQIQNVNTRVNSLDLDAYNKAITDYSTTQGVLNKFDEAYKELRIQRYSEADTFGSEAARRSLDLKVKSADNGISRFEYMQNYWSARHNVNMDVRNINIIDRFSLNVRGNSELISELDRLMRDGVYVDTNGNTVKINIKNMYGDFYYKTPSETKDWLIRQDPVTVYCNGYASEELTEALTVISSRYQRGALNAAEPGSKTPWIQKEKSPSDSDIRALIDTAYKNYGEKVGNAVNSYFIKPDGSYIGSSGMVIAVKNTFNKIDQLKEFELYLNNDIQYRDAFNSAITKQIDIDSPKQISSGSDTPATKTADYVEVESDLNSSSKSKDLNKTDQKYIIFGGTAATAGAITAILNSTNRKEIIGDKNNIIEEDILPIQDEKPESPQQQESNSSTKAPSSSTIPSGSFTDNNVKDATPSETEIPSYSPVSSEVDIQKNLNINSSINIINQNITDKIDFTEDINYNKLLSDSNLNFSNTKLYSTSIDKNLVAAINNKNENILITEENSLIYHSSKTNDFPSENIGDELLLNVIGSADLIRELDELMTTGKYTIEINGEKVSVELDELTNFKFSIIKDIEKWNYSYYPITLYFDGEVNEETFTAIEAIVMKYARGEANEIKGLDIEDLDTTNPWITKIKNPSENQLMDLVDKAADIDDDFMNNILIQCGNYVGMTGLQYLRALNIIEQYEEYSMDLV